MNSFPQSKRFFSTHGLAALLAAVSVGGAFADPGSDLAKQMNENQFGNSYVRLTLTAGSQSLQVAFKERRTAGRGDILYQILFPKERKGESVLVRQDGGSTPTGKIFRLPDKLENLDGSNLSDGLFGSDLAIQDIIENFFAWQNQSIVGTGKVDGKDCQILESRPGSGQWSAYGSVKSWIDPARLVPLKVEKYDRSGRLVRRIETKRVHRDGSGRHIPATMVVTKPGSGSVTELEGSKIRLGIDYTDETFSVSKMTDLSPR